jgi:hypothetical protein
MHITFGTMLILMIPLVTLQFTNEVMWDVADFIIMGTMIFCIGLIIKLVVKKIKNKNHRLVIIVGVILAFLYIWAELGVGIFTNLGS